MHVRIDCSAWHLWRGGRRDGRWGRHEVGEVGIFYLRLAGWSERRARPTFASKAGDCNIPLEEEKIRIRRERDRVAYAANRIEFGLILLFGWLLGACNIITLGDFNLEWRNIEKEVKEGTSKLTSKCICTLRESAATSLVWSRLPYVLGMYVNCRRLTRNARQSTDSTHPQTPE
jgi:hypothetical protein